MRNLWWHIWHNRIDWPVTIAVWLMAFVAGPEHVLSTLGAVVIDAPLALWFYWRLYRIYWR